MLAIEIAHPGGPEVLTPVDRPIPPPLPGEVLVKVAAAGVNWPDVAQRRGRYPPPPGASDIPGMEIAGTVERVGADVAAWQPGDQVCALVSGGGYAEYCVAPAPQCLPIPAGMSVEQAAGVPETYCTVWTNVFERGQLRPGEVLLVHGGASGIGTTAIQLARAFGARVFATAGSARKCEACLGLGAELAINYTEADFVAAAKSATGGRGVDVVLDMVGGEYLQRNVDVLATCGRLVMIGGQGTSRGQLDTMPVLQRRLTITGSTLRGRTIGEKGAIASALQQQVWPLFEAGTIHVVVHRVFSLRDAAEAHRLLESRTHIGKVVLRA